MALKKSEPYSSLWSSCDELRGGMDALPVPLFPEQTAIATVLSDMDAEIAALEANLAKTMSLKQGMMYMLLTGRIRLV